MENQNNAPVAEKKSPMKLITTIVVVVVVLVAAYFLFMGKSEAPTTGTETPASETAPVSTQ